MNIRTFVLWAVLSISVSYLFLSSASAQIIIDHSSVDLYNSIPDQYMAEVKKMLLNIPGESHSRGYLIGIELLSQMDPRFPAITSDGAAPAYTENALRVSNRITNQYNNWQGVGEQVWYTDIISRQRIKNHLDYAESNNLNLAAIGFGWCWDMTWHNAPSGGVDPIYGVRWAGSSVGGPEGDQRWGLDAADQTLTGNSISMNTYLAATEEYVLHSVSQGYNAKVLFTTGPVDGGGNQGESGYQRYLKHEHIRNYVKAKSDTILFDYADILTHNDSGQRNDTSWNGHTFPRIHADNMIDLSGSYREDGDHIGENGALRLAKALWVLMARIAGWDPGGADPILYGDVSQNGRVSSYDASLTAQHTVGIIQLDEPQSLAADVTGNGSISATDASWIARKVVDPTITFPVE